MVIKKEVLDLASTTLRMLKVDVNDKKITLQVTELLLVLQSVIF